MHEYNQRLREKAEQERKQAKIIFIERQKRRDISKAKTRKSMEKIRQQARAQEARAQEQLNASKDQENIKTAPTIQKTYQKSWQSFNRPTKPDIHIENFIITKADDWEKFNKIIKENQI